MSRIIRCAACTKRIKPHHPHIGVEDLEIGEEFCYHEAMIRAHTATQEALHPGGPHRPPSGRSPEV